MADEEFRRRIRVFRLPGAKMLSPLELARLRQILERAVHGAGRTPARGGRRPAGRGRLQALQVDAERRLQRGGRARPDRRHASTNGLRPVGEVRLR